MSTFAIWRPLFYIDGPVTATNVDQAMFAIDYYLDKIWKEDPQLGLNGEETKPEGEEQPVQPLSRKEFLLWQAEDPECCKYEKTIGLPTFSFNSDQDKYLSRISRLDVAPQKVVQTLTTSQRHQTIKQTSYRRLPQWITSVLYNAHRVLFAVHGKRSDPPHET